MSLDLTPAEAAVLEALELHGPLDRHDVIRTLQLPFSELSEVWDGLVARHLLVWLNDDPFDVKRVLTLGGAAVLAAHREVRRRP